MSISLDYGEPVLGGLLKAVTVFSTVGMLSAFVYSLGLLAPAERMAQSGFFSTQNYAVLLSIGITCGFLVSLMVARVSGRRNISKASIEDPLSVPPDAETA